MSLKQCTKVLARQIFRLFGFDILESEDFRSYPTKNLCGVLEGTVLLGFTGQVNNNSQAVIRNYFKELEKVT